MEHTPTGNHIKDSQPDLKLPWRLELADSEIRIKTTEHVIIHSEEWKDFPEYANAAISCAEFIVRAVNSHDELVAALEGLLLAFDYPEVAKESRYLRAHTFNDDIEDCRFVLKNAKEDAA